MYWGEEEAMDGRAPVAGRRAGVADDAEVVRRVKTGDVAAFEVLMRRYNQRLFRATRSILRDDAEAEDAVQQAWVNAYAHLAQFEERAKFSTWLTRIAIHEALARRRRRSRLLEVETMTDAEDGAEAARGREPDPERQALAAELRRALEASLDNLPAIYRSTFVLRDVEGLSTAEAAECLGVSEDVVKTRLSRARALLREELFDRAGVAAGDAFSFAGARCDRVVRETMARIGAPTLH
jgi:RNA polymerase sigma-70 factor (ECF subfamily)